MNRGMIIEIKGREVIVLTSEGVFHSIKRMSLQWQVGDEIDLSEADGVQHKHKRRFIPTVTLVASILLAFASLFIYSNYNTESETHVAGQEIGFVSLDINPSIEMSINDSFQVIQIKGLNEEGKQVIAKLDDWSLQPVDTMAIQLIQLAKEEGYLEENRDVLLSTSFIDDQNEMQYLDALEEELQKVEAPFVATTQNDQNNQGTSDTQNTDNTLGNDKEKEEQPVFIHRVSISSEVKAKAQEAGVSPGKYSIFIEAKEHGLEIELEDISKQSISSLAQELGGLGPIVSSINSKHHRVDAKTNDDQQNRQKDNDQGKEENKEINKAEDKNNKGKDKNNKGEDKNNEGNNDKEENGPPVKIIEGLKKGKFPLQVEYKDSDVSEKIKPPVYFNQSPVPPHVIGQWNGKNDDDYDNDHDDKKKDKYSRDKRDDEKEGRYKESEKKRER